jgi:hypothetical protein
MEHVDFTSKKGLKPETGWIHGWFEIAKVVFKEIN